MEQNPNIIIDTDLLNETYLDGFKYHELKEQLDKLGVGKAFKVGKKKDVIIKEALSQLAILKNLKEEGVDESEALAKLDELRLEEIKEIEVVKAEEFVKAEEMKEEGIKEIEKKEYDLEVLEKNLAIVNANLKLNIKPQRLILLAKKEKLVALIKKATE